jgi:cytochrome P450
VESRQLSDTVIDITDAKFKADPFAFYSQVREGSGVCRAKPTRLGEPWLVTRYADVSALLKDSRLTKNPAKALSPEQLARMRIPKMFAPLMKNMLSQDDPDHARLKKLVQFAFTPKRVDQLVENTKTISRGLLDRLSGRETFDLIEDYALPLPVIVISELLGVPKIDRDRFAHWSRILIRNSTVPWKMILSLPQIILFMRYLRRLVEMKRAEPDDALVSALVAAETEGERLSPDELLGMIVILLTAGHETTTNLIGNGTLTLLQNPDELSRLKDEPEIIDSAIEELLRHSGPVETATERYTMQDIEIAGTLIPRGSLVFGVIASANRDPQQFVEPDKLNLNRQPNRHLAFGEGGHYCVGAALARMEGRIAFKDLFERFPDLGLAVPAAKLKWRPGLILRGLDQLPLCTRMKTSKPSAQMGDRITDFQLS